MRSSNKSRSRNKNNTRRNTNNSGGNVVNRVFDSAGPEGRVRGTPQQIIEKYRALALDADLTDDRVRAESFHQHAEHYSRLLVVAQKEMADRQAEQNQRQAEQAQRQAEQQAQRQQNQQNQQQQPKPVEVSDEQPDVSGGFEANTGAQPDVPDDNIVATPENAPKPKAARAPRTRKKFTPEPVAAETPISE